ncbi:MAG TPA: YebC/PmpR family DNA-binding transcriptional regulator [Candidatus Hydrogenedentes bacterium]|nr:YebC/PmpR family DNA-binding transcriptional regulator [Candidatus Hydrogenedentota bacterium]HOV75676.1 YebC/PmpR family DNA-binding transcriptional regulator [Candidatus Hydrogenedentota bacterium]HPC16932.1 YebC/PmpR family DNA-binding transcriptional regulator [Candidatus Hydrogenedentota bacterium]HRT21552.1 YebC/PmpR family DNA-binding transcriptional regulator [Candidatus Hydrogenedentota bacterium]HRT65146.1 YebC/PmpR family DNA-binding transcriptional regulator [Candidatus Hydrogene
MSGHSKWSTIKHKKGAADAKRGKIFSRLAKEITIAAKTGGGDPAGNPRLRTVLMEARSENMPKENIERAIKKGTGELPGVSYDEVRYEGYAPGGVALIIDILTDNKNRTVAEIRHLLTRHGGSMAETNAVAWNFEQKGLIVIPKSACSDDEMLEKAIEAGAEDVDSSGDEFHEVTTGPTDLYAVAKALEGMGLKAESAKLTMIPKTTQKVEGKSVANVLKLMEALEEHDDVQNVYANFDISDEDMAAAMEG